MNGTVKCGKQKGKKTGLRKSVGSQWEILKYAKWARL